MLTVVRFSKYSFPKLQYISRARDYGLRKLKMLNVSNENLIALKWQNIHFISNVKFTAIYSKTCPSSLLYIQQRRILNPITLHSAKAYSELYQTSKIELFSKIVNSFHMLTIFAKCSILGG